MNTIMNAGFPATEELNDGARVTIRPLVPEDATKLLEGFARLSKRSRRQRFHCGIGHLNRAQLEFLTHPNQIDHIALCMQTKSDGSSATSGVGVARCVRAVDADDIAEVAVTVTDQWQGKGAGTALLRHLAAHAWKVGIRYWRASYFGDNRAVLALVTRHVTVTERCAAGDGVIEVVFSLAHFQKEQVNSYNLTSTTPTASEPRARTSFNEVRERSHYK